MTLFLQACLTTLAVALVALALGLVFGLFLGWSQTRKVYLWRQSTYLLSVVFRGLPELLLIFAFYYGGNALLTTLFLSNPPEISPFLAGALGLSVAFAGYAAQMVSTAIHAIPSSQAESGLALGLTQQQTFFRILLPQMIRRVLPGLGNLWQILLKDTALVSVLGLSELMQWAKLEGQQHREPFTYFFWVALVYAAFSLVSEYTLRKQQRRLYA